MPAYCSAGTIDVPLRRTIEEAVATVESAPYSGHSSCCCRLSGGYTVTRACLRLTLVTMLVKQQHSVKRDLTRLEFIVELHSAPGNVDVTRDV